MALEYRIDQGRRIVFGTAPRILLDEDLFAYQQEVWSRDDVAGYDEVIDLGRVEQVVTSSSGDRLRALADLAATMDVSGTPSKLAIVAPHDLVYGFARMFETYRAMNPQGSRMVGVFRSMQAALGWLDLERRDEPVGGDPAGRNGRS